jgi:hypothetical protein
MRRDQDTTAQADAVWGMLYRIGGICAGLFVALLVVATALVVTTPATPTAGGAATLEYIASNRTLYIVQQQLWLVPGIFAAVVYLALYPALKPLQPGMAALGCAAGGIAWALTLAMPTTSTGAPALVYLSDQYVATNEPAQRIALLGAAEGLIAINRTPTAVGMLTTVAMLIVSLVMLRGVFPRWIAYLGIATGDPGCRQRSPAAGDRGWVRRVRLAAAGLDGRGGLAIVRAEYDNARGCCFRRSPGHTRSNLATELLR